MRITTFLVLLLLAPTLALAQAVEVSEFAAKEARRQLTFAEEEYSAGNYERAVNSATSASRLDPTLAQAALTKALAYEKLGEPARAQELLTSYVDAGGELSPAATELKQRLTGADTKEGRKRFQLAVGNGGCAFEILSRKNYVDLHQEMAMNVAVAPAWIGYTTQSQSTGDNFIFGLGVVERDGDELDVDDESFEVILDSESLVAIGGAKGKVEFGREHRREQHTVEIWFDGNHIAIRIDGAAIGPVPVREVRTDAEWFLRLDDKARVWDFAATRWEGSLKDGTIPDSRLLETKDSYPTVASTASRAIPGVYDKDGVTSLRSMLPAADRVVAVDASMRMTCGKSSGVRLKVPDGRTVEIGGRVKVHGRASLNLGKAGLTCGKNEDNDVAFSLGADGAVTVIVNDKTFGPVHVDPTGQGDWGIELKGRGTRIGQLQLDVGMR